MSIKEGIETWKDMLSEHKSILIQRYIACYSNYAYKVRATYIPEKGTTHAKLMKNRTSINGENSKLSHSMTLKTPSYTFESQSSNKKHRNTLNDEKFLVGKCGRNSFEEIEIYPHKSIKQQMETLKSIIEKCNNYYHRTSIVEITADFVQDFDENWYFISMINFKTEKLLSKIAPAVFTGEQRRSNLSESHHKILQTKKSNVQVLNKTMLVKTQHEKIHENNTSLVKIPIFRDRRIKIENKRSFDDIKMDSNNSIDISSGIRISLDPILLKDEALKDLTHSIPKRSTSSINLTRKKLQNINSIFKI